MLSMRFRVLYFGSKCRKYDPVRVLHEGDPSPLDEWVRAQQIRG